jgi:hypothetical protein
MKAEIKLHPSFQFKDHCLIYQNVVVKRFQFPGIEIVKEGENIVINDLTLKNKKVVNTWLKLFVNLNLGLVEPFVVKLNKTFTKRFAFYHKIEGRKILIDSFEKQKKQIVISLEKEYFSNLNFSCSEESISLSCFDKEVLGNAVGKILGLRKGKLLKKDRRKFTSGYLIAE